MRSVLFLSVVTLVILACVQCQSENQPEEQKGGFRKWVGGLVMGTTTTTTTTTPKPTNIIDRAQKYYNETKAKAKIILDPRKAVETQIKKIVENQIKKAVGLSPSAS